jgi:NADH:ubiquinone oxidoreductase subunit D
VLREMVVGQTVADSIVALGSIDIVIGEVDR